MPKPCILVIRVNCLSEVFSTNHLIDKLARTFPGHDLILLATPQTETLPLLRHDPRFAKVLLFPTEGAAPARKTPAALRRLLRSQQTDLSVLVMGTTEHLDYSNQLLSMLVAPGKAMLLDTERGLRPLASLEGIGRIIAGFAGRARQMLVSRARRLAISIYSAARRKTAVDLGKVPIRPRVLWMPLDGLGDMIMSLPALHALALRYPQAEIDIVLREAYAGMLAYLPFVHRVITLEPPGVPRRTKRNANALEVVALAGRLHARRYDIAVDVGGKDIYRLLAFMSGAPIRVGPAMGHYDDPSRPSWASLMTHPVSLGDGARHASENAFLLTDALGIPRPEKPFSLRDFITGETAEKVRAEMHGLNVHSPFAIVQGASAVAWKQWSPERFAAVCDYLVERHDLDVLLSGGPGDHAYNDAIRAGSRHSERLTDIAGLFPLSALPALFHDARIMVTIDTGPMHIAASVGTPIVALFLPGAVHLFHPCGQLDGVIVPDDAMLIRSFTMNLQAGDGVLATVDLPDVLARIDAKLASARSPA